MSQVIKVVSRLQGDKPICAIYCRVANAKEQIVDAKAIEQQKQIVLEYARGMGYTNIVEYLDNGYSGNDPKRPALEKLNADIEAGRVGTVLMKDPSRVWRDITKCKLWFNIADRRGVTVLCQDAPALQADEAEMLNSRTKKKMERHTVRTPPPPNTKPRKKKKVDNLTALSQML